MNHPDTSAYLKIRKFCPTLQRRYMEMTSYLTSSKIPLQTMRQFNTRFAKWYKSKTVSIICSAPVKNKQTQQHTCNAKRE